MIVRALPWVAVLAFLGTVALAAGVTGLTYLPYWIFAAAPGLPVGWRLLGRQPPGWAAGAAIGYTMSALAIWVCVAVGETSLPILAVAWAAEWILLIVGSRVLPSWAAGVPTWTRRDTAGLSLVLLLVPALMLAPYRNLGKADQEGTRYYRAYFTADFVWHTALTHELRRFEMPPRNPYMASERLHYYWTYFLVPAAITARGPAAVRPVEPALKVNALCTAALLLSSFYLFAWTTRAGPLISALAVMLVAVAASAEGFVAIRDLLTRGAPLAALQDTNVDAISAWKYNGLRIDGVHRTMIYTPQHALSCALGLLALVPAALGGATVGWGGIIATGLLLGLATAVNPFLGAAFSIIYGLAIAADAARARASVLTLLRHGVAAIFPAAAVLWGTVNGMGEGAGEALTIGWVGFARNAPVVTLLLSLGPALVPALAGLLPDRRLPSTPVLVAGAGLLVGLFLLYFVVLSERSWVGFRAGQILLAMLTVPLARLFGRLSYGRRRWIAAALAVVILLIGAPTTIVDTYNASDIGNLRRGPGFPWTLTVTPAQQEAAAWVQAQTPPQAVVQMEPMVRGRGHWSFIPTFAGRRMAAGLPISLLPVPAYQAQSRRVQSIFQAADAAAAHQTARQLAIDYLWIDTFERQAYPAGVAMLESSPGYFQRAFTTGEVLVLRVR